ncbi:Uncharacterized protein dnm_029590 [Desulfonema magnum]|uniref:Uncharacterized protein n=1 Tax=Desulfonema magnum TaxID=45655 RepID=A0A975BK92_9BACT|nr:Uncharacterized protein dnm_029590 [Desulfonema magnum]
MEIAYITDQYNEKNHISFLIITDLGEADKAPWGRHICSIHHVRPAKPRGGVRTCRCKYAALTGLVGMPANLPLQICRSYGVWSTLP